MELNCSLFSEYNANPGIGVKGGGAFHWKNCNNFFYLVINECAHKDYSFALV